MGYLLKEALKTLCGVNQWCYAVFWKIGCQNPRLLIWEECYYSNAEHGVQDQNKIDLLVTKMMKDNHINLLGEGLVGRAAFTRYHQWIISDNKMLGVHPPEVSNEVYTQFLAGIQTIAVIPVSPHGVVQLGSFFTIMENIGFVNDAKSLISQVGCVPGALFSENYVKNEGTLNTCPNHKELICLGDSVSTHSSGKSKVRECNQLGHSPQALGGSTPDRHIGVASNSSLANPVICQGSMKSELKQNLRINQRIEATGVDIIHQSNWYSLDQESAFGSFLANHDPFSSIEQCSLSDVFSGNQDRVNNTMLFSGSDHMLHLADEHSTQQKLALKKQKMEHELLEVLMMPSEEACLKPSSRDDLFDIVGMDLKSKSFGGSWNNNVVNDIPVLELQGSDHLLDAVVSKVRSSSKQIADDNVSCRTSITKTSSSSVTGPGAYTSLVWGTGLTPGELVGVPKSLKTSSYSYKSGISREDISDSSSIISSQIRSWTGLRKTSDVASEHAKKADEISKSNRKRLKPGENPRPRPKDRQMIQDRVKELREIIPNGAKCSIDALLERTIKHMLFLQTVTKHADKLKQTRESKILGKDGGLLMEGGATWAYEVGSQSMVCPIIVEDLNSPRQMLVEMLCEGGGLFLDIAEAIKGLGLTILKGVMESRDHKIWAHFTVEADRDVTRMEIFMSLVRLFEQTGKTGGVGPHPHGIQ